MKNVALLFFLSYSMSACTKQSAEIFIPPADEVFYDIKLTLQWTSPSFVVPDGAHFTHFVGLVHSTDTSVWAPGRYASAGLEFVAEIGSDWRLESEMDAIIARKKGLEKFNLLPPSIVGSIDTTLRFTLQHSAISFASMIAPSPDWFVGIYSLNLLSNNKWIENIKVPLFIYDAGTEDGDIFGYDNPDSDPKQLIHLLTPATGTVIANGNTKLAPIGEIIFTKR